MSWEARDWAFEQWANLDCSPGARTVLFALADFANQHPDDPRFTCWPSRETIAKRTGLSIQGVVNNLKQLVEVGAIERTQRRRPGGQRDTDEFCLLIPEPWLDDWRKRNRMQGQDSVPEPTTASVVPNNNLPSSWVQKGSGKGSVPRRHCLNCPTLLARDNDGDYCSPCERAFVAAAA